MSTDSRITSIENRLDELTRNFLQMQKNQVPVTAKVDETSIVANDTSKKVDEVTPYKETKRGYYLETEKVFYDVPAGNVIVFFDHYIGQYSVKRIDNRLIVSFDALEKETDITIMIQ